MFSLFHTDKARLHLSQAVKFITCGLIGAVMEFTIIGILVGTYHFSPYLVYIPSALIPATFVFLFNKNVTFKASGQTAAQTRRFLMVYVVAFIINYLLSSTFYTFGSVLLDGHTIMGMFIDDQRLAFGAKALAIGMTAVFNYSFSHFFIFKKSAVDLDLIDTPVY